MNLSSQLTTKIKQIAPYWSLIGFLFYASTGLFYVALSPVKGLTLLSVAVGYGFFLFKGTMNIVQSVGPIYWITRDYVPANSPVIATAFMHEISAPWRHGKGIQIALFKRTFQIGICHKNEFDETSGVLAAVKGRFMDTPPTDIGNW